MNDDNATTQPNNPEFNGGVNDTTPPTSDKPEGDAPKPTKPEASNGDVLVQPELPEFNGGVNDDNAPTQPNNPEFNGGVNDTTPPTPNKPEGDAPKPTKPEASNGDALVQSELPEFTGGVNGAEAAVNEVLEFTGGVNAVEEAVNEVPEFDLSKLGNDKPTNPSEKSTEKVLPKTGATSSSTAALGLSLIALVSVVVRRKLSK